MTISTPPQNVCANKLSKANILMHFAAFGSNEDKLNGNLESSEFH